MTIPTPFHFIRFLLIAFALCPCSLLTADDHRPVVDDSKFAADKAALPHIPTLFLVGDSTLKSDAPMRGWGQEIGAFFDSGKINVVNRAIGGRSSRTFQTEGKWERVLSELKPGDFLLIQFGHNDAGKYDDPKAKGRPSLHGNGEETAEVARPDGSKEAVHTFGWYMRKYAVEGKAKGATVILCSMVPHQDWKDGKVVRHEQETFVKWTADAAQTSGVQFIDLNEIIAVGYEKLGTEKVEAFFADKRTHTSMEGAKYSAEAVVRGLNELPLHPLEGYLKKEEAADKKLK